MTKECHNAEGGLSTRVRGGASAPFAIRHSSFAIRHSSGFTLLEVVVVLFIVAMLLSVMFSISKGTMTLADDIQRHQRRENRLHAYIDFCEHLFFDLPATATLNMATKQEGGAYLSTLEFQNVSSPFDGTPGQVVTLFTEAQTGGGLRLVVTCKKMPDPQNPQAPRAESAGIRVVLFDSLAKCEWRAFDPASNEWATLWREQLPTTLAPPVPVPVSGNPASPSPAPTAPGVAPVVPRNLHPPLLELTMAVGIDDVRRWVFWVPPSDPPQY
ncbi:MAG: prepilin-type N-terminal cleavage/methylation domain-containing protein [Verrucomicrobiaceae bacterium]